MREIVILLLVVALVVLVIGAVNQDQMVDLDYVFGTWEDVSILMLAALSAGAAIVLGLVIAAMARLRVVADRRKLERELQLVYPRLREAERAAGLPAWSPPSEAVAPATASAVAAIAVEPPPPPLVAAETEDGSAADKASPTEAAPLQPEAPAGAAAEPSAEAAGMRPEAPGEPDPERSPNGAA